jgi:hypothetical protein
MKLFRSGNRQRCWPPTKYGTVINLKTAKALRPID